MSSWQPPALSLQFLRSGRRIERKTNTTPTMYLRTICRPCLAEEDNHSVLELAMPSPRLPFDKCQWCGAIVGDFKFALMSDSDPVPPFG